jgi:hypothetical protein
MLKIKQVTVLALISGLACIQAADKVFTVDIKSVEHP